MATIITDFPNVLPDPVNLWKTAGSADSAGTPIEVLDLDGPGFADYKLTSIEPIMKTVTASNRVEKTIGSYHTWVVNINYNKIPRIFLNSVIGFLGYKNSTMSPFYVSIPPYSTQSDALRGTVYSAYRGETTLMVNATGLSPGKVFYVNGSTKVYMITRVETETYYLTGDTFTPAPGQEKIHFVPSLEQDVIAGTDLIFAGVNFYMLQTDDMDYSLDTNNLYSMSLTLEEYHA